MQTRTLLLAAAAALSSALPLAAQAHEAPAPQTPEKAQADKPQTKRPDIYDESADARAQIDAALRRAKKENRRVLIQWGANWCGWCHLLHEHFKSDKDVARKLLYEYDLVLVDVGRGDRNADLVGQYGSEFKKHGLPYLTVLDSHGKVLANQETGSLEKPQGTTPPGHDGAKVLAFLTAHQAPYKPAESLLQDALVAAKADDKKVFLHFGAPWCGWCHRLEDWLARADVADVLGRSFIDLKIDTERTIGGQDMMLRYTGGKQGGIPWFAFLDGRGEVLATSFNAEGKNLGCPWEPSEIADFKKTLRTVAPALSEGDIDKICAHLGEKKTAQ